MSDPKQCPIVRCSRGKSEWNLTCPAHWRRVPKAKQVRLYALYKGDKGSDAHRKLCFEILHDLNEAELERL